MICCRSGYWIALRIGQAFRTVEKNHVEDFRRVRPKAQLLQGLVELIPDVELLWLQIELSLAAGNEDQHCPRSRAFPKHREGRQGRRAAGGDRDHFSDGPLARTPDESGSEDEARQSTSGY